MATVSKQQIADFVAANLDNPQAIADAAAQYGVSSTDIASAMNVDVGAVNNYFSNAAVAPPPVEIAPTPAPNQFVASTAPGSVGTSYGQASGDLIGQVQQQNPELATALQTGTASVSFNADTGTSNLINTQTGAPIGGDYQVQVGTNGVGINIPTASGAVVQASVTTDQNGAIAPVTASQVYNTGLNAGAGGFAGGGQVAKDAVAIGLAYAIPVVGEMIAEEIGVSASIGTALAATAVNVSQGQDLVTALKNALPALIAKDIITSDMGADLLDKVSNDSSTKNLISNVAKSVTQTAIAGGSPQDLIKNAITSGGGTLIGQTLISQGVDKSLAGAYGQALATNAITGSTLPGLIAGSSALGAADASAQAKALQAEERAITAEGDKPTLSSISAQDQAVLDQMTAQPPTGTGLDKVTVTGAPSITGDTIIPKASPIELPKTDIITKAPVDLGDVTIPPTISNAPSVGALQPVTVTGKKDVNLGDVTITGSDIPYSGSAVIEDPKAAKLQPVTVTGKKDVDLGDVTVTGSAVDLGNVTISASKDNTTNTSNTTSNVPDDSNVSVVTSYIPPKTTKIKASSPTIQGQFASPLTAAVSAYTPAGEIPGQETGKEKQDVWNQESLREGLGL